MEARNASIAIDFQGYALGTTRALNRAGDDTLSGHEHLRRTRRSLAEPFEGALEEIEGRGYLSTSYLAARIDIAISPDDALDSDITIGAVRRMTAHIKCDTAGPGAWPNRTVATRKRLGDDARSFKAMHDRTLAEELFKKALDIATQGTKLRAKRAWIAQSTGADATGPDNVEEYSAPAMLFGDAVDLLA